MDQIKRELYLKKEMEGIAKRMGSWLETARLMMSEDASRVDQLMLGAALAGRPEEMPFLARQGARADVADRDGVSALMHTLEFPMLRQFDTVHQLLDLGGSVKVKDKNGMGPLGKLSPWSLEPIRMMRRLVSLGADPNDRDNQEKTALMKIAGLNGQRSDQKMMEEARELAKELIESGADLNLSDYEGSALSQAAAFGHLEWAQLLVEAGASLSQRNGEGRTPREIAEKKNHTAVAMYLKSMEEKAELEKVQEKGVHESRKARL